MFEIGCFVRAEAEMTDRIMMSLNWTAQFGDLRLPEWQRDPICQHHTQARKKKTDANLLYSHKSSCFNRMRVAKQVQQTGRFRLWIIWSVPFRRAQTETKEFKCWLHHRSPWAGNIDLNKDGWQIQIIPLYKLMKLKYPSYNPSVPQRLSGGSNSYQTLPIMTFTHKITHFYDVKKVITTFL